jgi:hypothetical protein
MTQSAMKQRVVSPDMSLVSTLLLAEQCDSPNNVNWKVAVVAPIVMDDANNAIAVRGFNDSTEQGIGFMLMIPDWAGSIKLNFTSRAKVAPGTAKNVVPKLYFRGVLDNGAIDSWSTGYDLSALVMPTNLYFQVDTQTIAFSTLGITRNRMHQFELTRKVAGVSDNLPSDWYLLSLEVMFI